MVSLGCGTHLGGFILIYLQEDKIYVQHRVREQSKLLWDLIANKNANFYIAG